MSNLGVIISIVVAWGLAIAMALPIVLSKFKAKKETIKKVNTKLDKINVSVTEFESRLQIVRSHAIDYLNSLGSDGARQMSEIQNLLSKIQIAADQAKILLETEKLANLRLAEKILDGKEPVYLEDSGAGNLSNWEFKIASGWHEDVEKKLQELGACVASASSAAKNNGIPTFGRQYKRETIHDLKEAGIDITTLRGKITPQ